MTDPGQEEGTGQEGGTPPSCYRHPGRETYVACTRCGRYACPDCMRSASVGQQCVECVKQAAEKRRIAEDLGADAVVDSASEGLAQRLRVANRGKAVDVVLEM